MSQSKEPKVFFWHKLDPLFGGTFRGRQPRQFGTFLTHKRHSCIAANYPSLDHLVGPGEQRWWDGEAERIGGLDVYSQLAL